MLTGETITDEQIQSYATKLPHRHYAKEWCFEAIGDREPSKSNARQRIAEMINSDNSSVTGDTITAEQIREMRDEYPELISGEKASIARAIPFAHTTGGIPIYPDANESQLCRNEIAALYRAKRG